MGSVLVFGVLWGSLGVLLCMSGGSGPAAIAWTLPHMPVVCRILAHAGGGLCGFSAIVVLGVCHSGSVLDSVQYGVCRMLALVGSGAMRAVHTARRFSAIDGFSARRRALRVLGPVHESGLCDFLIK